MKRLFLIGILLLSFATLALSAQESDTLYIMDGWVRATALSEDNAEPGGITAAYMTIENPTDNDFTLIDVSSDAAETIEIHQTSMENDVMRMSPLEGGLAIPAGETITLEPGGYHIMLIDLTDGLIPDQAISLDLAFSTGEDDDEDMLTLTYGFPVYELLAGVPDNFVIINPWSRPTGDEDGIATEVSAVYMTLINRGERDEDDDTLVSASTDVAETVEIHQTSMENDVMRMSPLEGGLAIPAGETITLEPGGYHIMLIDIQENLLTGDAFMLTLEFESGLVLDVAIPVYERDMVMMDMDNDDEEADD